MANQDQTEWNTRPFLQARGDLKPLGSANFTPVAGMCMLQVRVDDQELHGLQVDLLNVSKCIQMCVARVWSAHTV